jgi:hypothetical protein
VKFEFTALASAVVPLVNVVGAVHAAFAAVADMIPVATVIPKIVRLSMFILRSSKRGQLKVFIDLNVRPPGFGVCRTSSTNTIAETVPAKNATQHT